MRNSGMAIDSMTKILDALEGEEYTSTFRERRRLAMEKLKNLPFTTRFDLQKREKDISPGTLVAKTSGSTGIPVIVPKTTESEIWLRITNARELRWRKWDLNKGVCAVILAGTSDESTSPLTNIRTFKMRPIKEIQKLLVNSQPTYLYTYPSIVSCLDLSTIPSLIDIKTVGEHGGSNYSCEEAGTISLQCPDFPENHHIMENIIVESHPEHGAVITDLSNPAITRYILGDIVDLAREDDECPCGRILPVIKKIYGRKRNMFVLPNGDRVWPTVGEPKFRSDISKKIQRHRVIQKSLYALEIQVQLVEALDEDEICRLKDLVKATLGYEHLSCKVVTVEDFPKGKFEAFVSEI